MVARTDQPRRRVPTSRYRRLEVRTFGDEKFQQLSPIPACGQGLWLYLLLGPFTTQVPGLVVGGEAAMAEALRWSLKAFRRCWDEVAGLGMAKADWTRRLVWLPNGFRHNEPANQNVVLGWRSTLLEIPECPLRIEVLATLERFLQSFAEPFRQAFAQASAKGSAQSGCRMQEQDPPLPPQGGFPSGSRTRTGLGPVPPPPPAVCVACQGAPPAPGRALCAECAGREPRARACSPPRARGLAVRRPSLAPARRFDDEA